MTANSASQASKMYAADADLIGIRKQFNYFTRIDKVCKRELRSLDITRRIRIPVNKAQEVSARSILRKREQMVLKMRHDGRYARHWTRFKASMITLRTILTHSFPIGRHWNSSQRILRTLYIGENLKRLNLKRYKKALYQYRGISTQLAQTACSTWKKMTTEDTLHPQV